MPSKYLKTSSLALLSNAGASPAIQHHPDHSVFNEMGQVHISLDEMAINLPPSYAHSMLAMHVVVRFSYG